MRTFDPEIVRQATAQYAENIEGFNPEEWLETEENVALTNDKGDVALFQRELPGVVCGHYFFHSRGKEAVKVAKKFLEEAFTGPYNIHLIRGLTPLQHLGARWMNRQLKFKSYGVVQAVYGPCELVILTRQEWESASKENN